MNKMGFPDIKISAMTTLICLFVGGAMQEDVDGSDKWTFSAQDIMGEKGWCKGQATCTTPPGPKGYKRNCECDPPCRDYDDCCTDSRHFRPGKQQATCFTLRQYGSFYMFSSCPGSWNRPWTRSHCENPAPDSTDPLDMTPVTNRLSGRTYSNIHCAVCHGDTDLDTLSLWKPRLECPGLPKNLTFHDIATHLTFDQAIKRWTVETLDGETHICKLDPMKPEGVDYVSRKCSANVIQTCAATWSNNTIRQACESYTSYVYDLPNRAKYRNPHCAVCNNVPIKNLTCTLPIDRGGIYNFDMNSFAVLFDYSHSGGRSEVGKIRACPEGDQLFDPFFRICRDVFCSEGRSYVEGSCLRNNEPNSTYVGLGRNNTETTEYNISETTANCPKFKLNINEYKISDDNVSIYVEKYTRSFSQGEYIRFKSGQVEVCISKIGERFVDKFGPTMGFITLICLGISILFLTFHLIAFALFAELRNLSGKNLASLCLSLLCSYCSFIAMSHALNSGPYCIVTGFTTYYSFMASFSWSLTIGFDIWRTLKLATSRFRISSGKQRRKFLLYSLWSWGMPLMLLGIAASLEYSPYGAVPDDNRPGFGRSSCWFGNRKSLLLLFALPSGLVMLLNLIFACSSASLIIRTTNASNLTTSVSRKNVRLYIRLTIIMGLTWTVGLFAGYFDVAVLWYVFVALNTLQGLFIFLAFTCSGKVMLQARELPCFRTKKTRPTEGNQEEARPSCWPKLSTSSTVTTQLDTNNQISPNNRTPSFNQLHHNKLFNSQIK